MILRIFLILALFSSVAISGCIEKRQDIGPEVKKLNREEQRYGEDIETVIKDPEAFNGREITVAGKVMPGLAFSFINEQPYQIIQGDSLLWVITDEIPPAEGAFVEVRGRIAVPYQIKGRSYQIVLLEEERR